MSNPAGVTHRSVSVLSGSTTRTSLRLSASDVCQLQQVILFASASSFVRPTSGNKAAFRDLIRRLQNPGTLIHLLITGHTDSVGSDSDNRALSERRAENAQAVLQGNTGRWETMYSVGDGRERWGTPELTTMVVETGEADPTNSAAVNRAVSRYQGAANQSARTGLFQRYFARLLSANTVPSITATNPPWIAYGEEQLLRGSRLSPSKDPSLPPIRGDFEPNRRVEFFFMRSAGVVRSEYPRWMARCSLRPPAPAITVTIASIETIRRNRTANIQINLSPSPLPWGTSITLTLSTTTGTGEARFTRTNSTTMTITQSEAVTVRGITASSALDNIRLTATVTGQTRILAQENFTVIDAISIFLRFEVWDLITHRFEPLPAGVDVDVMDYEGPLLPDDRLVTRQTDAQGHVFFNVPNLRDPDEPEPDIFFLAHTNGRSHAHHTPPHHTLPQEWSTKGWKAADGSAGYYDNYTGAPLGTPSSPLVFRIGLDFHAKLTYHVNGGRRIGHDDPAPSGVLVKLMQEQTGSDRELLVLRTKNNGEIHGVSFDAEPGSTFYLNVTFEIEDSDVHLKKARFSEVPFVPSYVDIVTPAGATLEWDSNDTDADRNDFLNYCNTSIGSVGSPEIFHCTLDNRNVALYILKVLRELAVFLFKMTQGDWEGVEVAVTPTAPVRAFSWPVGRIQLKYPNLISSDDDRWDRETVIHEMAHQVMWEEVNFSTLGIAYEGLLDDLHLFHRENLLANPTQALIEGWAEFVEAIFEGSGTPPFSVLSLVDTDSNPVPGGLGPPPNNRGESVEGALANGLWAIFQNHVISSGSAHVPESANGDIMTTTAATWLRNSTVQDRFLSMIWRPLKDLKPMSNPTSTAMIEKIRSHNSTMWHSLQPELQAFNMAMHSPTITAISPSWGPIAGGQSIGQSVTITGTNFIARTAVTTGATLETRVEFGGVAATSVTINSSDELTVVPPPHAAGAIDVIVTTPAGSATETAGYVYIDDLLMVNNVDPATVSTNGGDQITISGQGFLPGAIVSLDGVPVNDISVSIDSPMLISVITPQRSSPGSVSVVVQNPDSNLAIWSGQLQYTAPPQISFISPPSGPSSGGTRVDIHGSNFHQQVEVVLDQTTLAQVDWVDSGHIRIVTLGGTPGPVAGEVKNPDRQSDSFEFYYE